MHSNRRSVEYVVLFALAFGVLTGCASSRPPARFIDGVNHVTLEHKVRDAKAQRVAGWPCLRVNAAIDQKLHAAMTCDTVDDARAAAHAFIDDAHNLSLASVENELDRLDDKGWQTLAETYFQVSATPDEALRSQIRQAFRERTDLQVWFLRRAIDEAATPADIRAALDPVKRSIETPVSQQGRFARAAPFALFTIPSAIAVSAIHADEFTGDMDVPFAHGVRYTFDGSTEGPHALGPDAELLRRYAPAITQETMPDANYDGNVDSLGRITVDNDLTVNVDTSRPVVYAYSRTVEIGGATHRQLIYTWWYPEHPNLKGGFDAEAGRIEGVSLRITLGSDNRPAVYETVYNCGCFHRVYPTQQVESAAQQAFGKPQKDKRFAVERRMKGTYDMIVPKIVSQTRDRSVHPEVRTRAGWHGIVNVAADNTAHADEAALDAHYALMSYDDLEHLHTPDGRVTSMFYDNGLVRGAERAEGIFFTPVGMLSAGQPRQRGTQLIHWDHYDFDDVSLLDKTLRLPREF